MHQMQHVGFATDGDPADSRWIESFVAETRRPHTCHLDNPAQLKWHAIEHAPAPRHRRPGGGWREVIVSKLIMGGEVNRVKVNTNERVCEHGKPGCYRGHAGSG